MTATFKEMRFNRNWAQSGFNRVIPSGACPAVKVVIPDTGSRAMRDPAYAAFSALDPFFDIVMQGLAGLVDGDHYFDTIAPDAVFEFRYRFPGYPTKVVGREALIGLRRGYDIAWRRRARGEHFTDSRRRHPRV